MNATAVPSKRSAVERRLDRLVAGVFALLPYMALWKPAKDLQVPPPKEELVRAAGGGGSSVRG